MGTMVRISDDLKRQLDAYCFVTGLSLTRAVDNGVTTLLAAVRNDPAMAARMDSALDAMPPR